MLLDRGLVDPIDVDAWTRPGPPSAFTSVATILAAQLVASASTLDGSAGTMASGSPPRVDDAAGTGLSDAEVSQASFVDSLDGSTIGDVSGHADNQSGDLVGYANDTASDIAAGAPQAPPYVPHGLGEDGNPSTPLPPGEAPPGTPVPSYPTNIGDQIEAWYHDYLRRTASVAEINGWSAYYTNLPAILDGILNSGEYAGDVNGLYQQYFGRDASDDELGTAIANHWTLDQVEADLQNRS